MLNKLERAQQQWGGSSVLVDNWLDKRQELLVTYCQVAGLPPFDDKGHSLPSIDEVQEFCGKLVDYVSAGHFEIYNEVVSQCETHGRDSLRLAERLIPKITETTDVALDFNDKYAEQQQPDLNRLDDDLSRLVQGMEIRFELEDQLLDTLHQKHSNNASA